jgi:CBS domain-containing protein
VETAAISYRVADFLKKYPPFNAVADADLLAVSKNGRVRFYEPNEYILWQGEPHKPHVYVIQQGTVSIWDEAGGRSTLRDVRGAGDMLGIERYISDQPSTPLGMNGARSCLSSARSESDVVVYGFPAEDFEACILKYPHAVEYVAAEGRVTPDYQPSATARQPHRLFLHDVIGRRPLPACGPDDTIAHAADVLRAAGTGAIAVADAERHLRGLLTVDSVLAWIAAGGGNVTGPVAGLLVSEPLTVAPGASVADTVLAMSAAGVDAIALTADGTAGSAVEAIVTARDLGLAFGDQPAALAREIRRASTIEDLGSLMRRSRAIALDYLTGASAVDWLARFLHLTDVAIVNRLTILAGGDLEGCWCFYGSAGREESLTALAPSLAVILDEHDDPSSVQETLRRVLDGLSACGYLPRVDLPFEPAFYAATVGEWQARYRVWVRDPIQQQTYRARTLFDLRPVLGQRSLWRDVDSAVIDAVDRDFVQVLANDCLANLPPLTFFEDAVVDSVGEHQAIFRLEQHAVRPLVDVGRVFGLAAKLAMGQSTLERFMTARRLLPEHEAVFREAADTLRIVLWQQGRVGISRGTSGSELPPALLSRSDRQVLKSGFRSILRLLELAASPAWLDRL